MSRIENVGDMHQVYRDIRKEIGSAKTRGRLSTIYRQALSVITHSFASSWKKKYGSKLPRLRSVAKEEFTRTVRAINKRARKIGSDKMYDETYGDKKSKAA